MEFSLQAIQEAHSKYTGPDFPKLIREFKAALKRNQTGVTDFPTFCSEMVQAGVYKWVSDLEEMTCSYYDLQEKAIIVEEIPSI
ncbi:MAG: hypothetical protein K0S04_3777 [Herbinix sp.]|nr:hypothetical protein [Herbinix sp.]